VWGSHADLLKVKKLREIGGDDEKGVQEIVHHLLIDVAFITS